MTVAAIERPTDWTAIVAVVLGVTCFAVAQGVTYPLIPLALEQRHVAAIWIGVNAASFAAGLALITLLIRRATAVVAGEKLIVLALAGCSLSLATFWMVDRVWVWCLARLVLGLCAGAVFIISEAWLHSACPDRIRGRISGLYGAGMSIGFAAGPLAIPLLGTKDGFAFALVAVYVALVAFLMALLGRHARTSPHPVPPGALLRFARTAPTLLVLVVAFALADIAAISGMPVYFVRTGHSEAFAAISVTVLSVPTALAQPIIGTLLDRFPRRLVAVGVGTVTGCSFVALAFLRTEPAILALFALIGAASFALYTSALTLLGERFSGGMLVAGSAAFSLAYAFGSASGSTLAGVALEISPAAVPIATGLAVLILTAVFLADRQGSKPRVSSDSEAAR